MFSKRKTLKLILGFSLEYGIEKENIVVGIAHKYKNYISGLVLLILRHTPRRHGLFYDRQLQCLGLMLWRFAMVFAIPKNMGVLNETI